MKTYFKFSMNYRQVLVNLDEDLCAILAGSSSIFFISSKNLIAETNVLEGCPFTVNDNFYLNISFKKLTSNKLYCRVTFTYINCN